MVSEPELRLKIYDGASTEVSNNIFPVHKWWVYNKTTTTDQRGRELGFQEMYELLQSAFGDADPSATVKQALWGDGGDVFNRLVFYWQLVMANRDVSHIGDGGWDLIRLLYLNERLFNQAASDKKTWAAAAGKSQVGSMCKNIPTLLLGLLNTILIES